MKCSRKLLAVVLGIALSGSIGFGAPLDEVNGIINGADNYLLTVTDAPDVGEPFEGTGLDIHALHWGAIDDGGLWYTIGMTVTGPPINTIGDGSGTPPSPTMTNVQLNLRDGGVDKYLLQATMFGNTVLGVYMIDRVTSNPVAIDPADIKYKVDTGLEIAIKQSYFANLSPAGPFDFKLDFGGGGTDADDNLIPEPATMSILMIGGLCTLARRRRKRLTA